MVPATTIDSFLQRLNARAMSIQTCGRSCANMDPATLPDLPPAAPLSLLALVRANPDLTFKAWWLVFLDASATVH